MRDFDRKFYLAALKGGVATALLGTAALSLPASAQEQQEQATKTEEIIITGSRIAQPEVTSVSPLLVTTSEEVKLSGYTRIEDLMNSLPQIETSQNAFISNGSTGIATLDLRGLGSNRTLVLVNGRRLQPGSIFQIAADVNQIPASLVERVEVVTGGASSVYGADAVAGVVNFIMKKDFEGIEISGGTSFYQHKNNNKYLPPLMDARNFTYPTGSVADGQQYTVDLIMGGAFADGRGHATVYANFRDIAEVREGARDYSSCALNNAGTACGGSFTAIVPNFDLYPIINGVTDYDQNMFLTLNQNATDGSLVSAGGNLYNYAPINFFQRPDQRWSFGAFIDYEINEHVKPYAEVSFMRNRTVAQIAESGTFFAEEYAISCSSPLLSPAQVSTICGGFGLGANDSFAAYIGKRNVEGGPRQSRLEHNSFRMIVGSKGEIANGWTYDVSGQYGSTSASQAYVNDFFAPKIADAINVTTDSNGNLVCASGNAGCIPYEVFKLNGVTPEMAKTLSAVGTITGITKEYIINAYVTGDLPLTSPLAENAIAVVLGTEYRKEVFDRLSDEVFEQGLLLGQGGPTKSVAGSYDVKEIFTEAQVPLIQDQPLVEDLSLELGYRYSDYSTSGGNSTYKVGLNYQPMSLVKLRGSFNRAVRAANALELFSAEELGLWSGIDPCSGASPELTQAQCALTGVTASQYGNIAGSPASQYNALYGGNRQLAPEKADTWTVGAVMAPLDGFQASIDYWNVKIDDVISTVPPELAIRQCGLTGDPVYCNLVNRAPNGSLWLGNAGYVVATNVNLASLNYRGIDLTSDYQVDVLGGSIRANFIGTLLLEKSVEPLPGLGSYDCKGLFGSKCFPSPEWRHTLRTTYSAASFWSASIKWRYIGKVTGEGLSDNPLLTATVSELNKKIKAQSYFDVSASFDIFENLGLTIGVNNIFDKEPPMVGGAYSTNANTVAGFYDTLGRYIFANASVRF